MSEDKPEIPTGAVKEVVTEELKELFALSKALNFQIKNAKTETKAVYLRKKLIKNNQQAMQMIIALNGLRGGK